jgi:hypothetical protein
MPQDIVGGGGMEIEIRQTAGASALFIRSRIEWQEESGFVGME